MGTIDYLLGPELSFSVFYLIPIFPATWYGGRSFGIGLSIFASLVWMIVEMVTSHSYSHAFIPVWNASVRLLFFLIIALLLSKIRRNFEYEEGLADTDTLTGLANLRAFYEKLAIEVERSKRYKHPLTLIYFDLDNFKAVNDTQGHDAGDEVLKSVSAVLNQNVRKIDVVARLGGDEFVALFPEADISSAEAIIQNFRPQLNSAMQEKGWPVTFSIGAVVFERPMDNIREMVNFADELMYSIKRKGKDNVVIKQWPEKL